VIVFEILGIAGIAISMLAYVPQVVHLGREHCSAGVSRRAWAMWVASSLLIGALALHRRDPVFIMLQVSTLASAVIILFLAYRYRGMACAFHAHARRPASPAGLSPAMGRAARGRLRRGGPGIASVMGEDLSPSGADRQGRPLLVRGESPVPARRS
jgi:lipid-A-disaccharide synthase-like uncharacterized protein